MMNVLFCPAVGFGTGSRNTSVTTKRQRTVNVKSRQFND
jgi:hypothetical protein